MRCLSKEYGSPLPEWVVVQEVSDLNKISLVSAHCACRGPLVRWFCKSSFLSFTPPQKQANGSPCPVFFLSLTWGCISIHTRRIYSYPPFPRSTCRTLKIYPKVSYPDNHIHNTPSLYRLSRWSDCFSQMHHSRYL